MTIALDLLNQIQMTLGSAISPSLTTLSDTSDIFEAYVFSLVIEAATTEGAAVRYRDVHGNSPTVFVFRTSPGYIFSKTQSYTHAVISFQNKPPLEAHVGVRVVGKSRVLHECDVAVIEQAEAEMCRLRLVAPRSSKVLIAIECKFYSTPLQLNLARAFLGLTSDLSATKPVFVTNSSSDSLGKIAKRSREALGAQASTNLDSRSYAIASQISGGLSALQSDVMKRWQTPRPSKPVLDESYRPLQRVHVSGAFLNSRRAPRLSRQHLSPRRVCRSDFVGRRPLTLRPSFCAPPKFLWRYILLASSNPPHVARGVLHSCVAIPVELVRWLHHRSGASIERPLVSSVRVIYV